MQGNGYLADDSLRHALAGHNGLSIRLHTELVSAPRVVAGCKREEVMPVRKNPKAVRAVVRAGHGRVVGAGDVADDRESFVPAPLQPAKAARRAVDRLAVNIVAPCAGSTERHKAQRLELVAVAERPDGVDPVVVRELAFAKNELAGRVSAPCGLCLAADLQLPSAAFAARYAVRAQHRVHMPPAVVVNSVLVARAVWVEVERKAVNGEEARFDAAKTAVKHAGLHVLPCRELLYAVVALAREHIVRNVNAHRPAAVLGVPRDLSGHRYLHRAIRARGDLQAYGAGGVLAPAVPYAAAVLCRRERRLCVAVREVASVKANRLQNCLPVAHHGKPAVFFDYVKRSERRAPHHRSSRRDSNMQMFHGFVTCGRRRRRLPGICMS